MNTIKGWFGYGNSQTPETNEDAAKSMHNETTTNKLTELANEQSDQKNEPKRTLKPVLSTDENLFERFDSWARKKLPLQPEDKLDAKLITTSIATFGVIPIYKITNAKVAPNDRVFRFMNRFCLFGLWGTFMLFEWYYPLYIKYHDDGQPVPRTFMKKMQADAGKYRKLIKDFTGKDKSIVNDDSGQANSETILNANNNSKTDKK